MIEQYFDKLMIKMNRKAILKAHNQQPYLIRYYIYGKNASKLHRGRGLYIQKIILSDTYEHLHDHPWRWGRFILKGQFIELIRNKNMGLKVKKIKRFYCTPKISSRMAHTQKLVNNQPVWMILWHGKYKHHWGFWVNNEKVYWRDYFKSINKETSPVTD